jgi:hypothetical protein
MPSKTRKESCQLRAVAEIEARELAIRISYSVSRNPHAHTLSFSRTTLAVRIDASSPHLTLDYACVHRTEDSTHNQTRGHHRTS